MYSVDQEDTVLTRRCARLLGRTLIIACACAGLCVALLRAAGPEQQSGPDHGVAGSVRSLVIQPEGKILAVGSLRTVPGQRYAPIARLNPDGSLDPTFDPGRPAQASAR
jgi:hypothetical protein